MVVAFDPTFYTVTEGVESIHSCFSTTECPDLPDIPNGSVVESGFTTGDTAIYSCGDGFELVGNMERVCMSDSTWSGAAPFCSSLAGKNILQI